jgi:xylitol oxidase
VAIHFTLKQNTQGVMSLLPKIEQQLAPFNVRPHWGKLFSLAPAVLQARYSQVQAFRELAQQHDPEGKFSNSFMETNLYSS